MSDEGKPATVTKPVKADPPKATPWEEAAAHLETAAKTLEAAKGPRVKSYRSIAQKARELAARLTAL